MLRARWARTTGGGSEAHQLAIYIVDSNTSFEVKIDPTKSLTATWRERFDSEARDRGARSNRDGQVLFGVRMSLP